jgi:hypothetical protein
VDDPTADQRADAIAARQYGAIGHAQTGMSSRQIERRRKSGRWVAAGKGVSIIAAVSQTSEQQVAVAILRGPPGAVASHLTALALYGVCGYPARPHVTVRPQRSGRLKGVTVHHSPLASEDVTVAAGLSTTTPARGLVDAATMVGYERLCELVDRTLYLRLATADDVRAAMLRASKRPGRTGLARLEAALAIWAQGEHPGSQAEMRLFRRIEAWGLPLPERQMVVYDGAGRRIAQVDGGYRLQMAILEYQGQEFHGPRRQPLDEERRAQLEGLGWTILWVTSIDLRLGATELRSRLTQLLEGQAAA